MKSEVTVMPHIDHVKLRSRNLKPADLGATGALDLTIESVREEELRDDDGTVSARWVCYFEDHGRGLVLNKTTLAALADLCGSDVTEDWRGKRVCLYATTAPYRGDLVPVIRVRAARP